MDDRDLEARLSARLHQRFDRAEPPPSLSRDISDARLYARPSSRRSDVVSLLAAAAVLAVAVVALGAWFSRTFDTGAVPTASPSPTVSSSSPTPSPTPAPTPSSTPGASPTPTPASVGDCVAVDLTAQLIRWEGAAGSRFGTIAMQSYVDCTVNGTPGVLLLDGSDDIFLNSADLGAPAATAPTTPVFTLRAARVNTIYIVIRLSNYCGSAPTLPVSVSLALPGWPGAGGVGAKAATGVTIDMAPCNGADAPTTLDVQQPWSTTAP